MDLFRPDDHRGDLRCVYGRVVKLSARQLRNVDQLVADLFDLAGDFFPGFHPELDDLPGVLLQNAHDGIARLEINLALGEKIGAGQHEQTSDDKEKAFHAPVVPGKGGVCE